MISESSMNATVDPNSTLWKSAEVNRTSPQWQSLPFGTVNYAKAAILWTIFVVGVSGNLLVIAAGVKGHGKGNKGQTTVTRMFICCLAVSDLGLMLTSTWTSAMSAIRPSWSYGSFFCKLNMLWSSMSSKMSVTMLSVIGVDRYLGLSQPGMMSFFSTRTAALLIAITWVVVTGVCVPMFLWFDVVHYSPTFLWCTTTGVSNLSEAMYSLTGQVALFYVPLAVTLASYLGIWYKMYFAKKKTSNQI